MRPRRLAPAAALAGVALVAAGEATAWELTVGVEPETVTVGDRVRVTLTLTAPDGTAGATTVGAPRFPAWGDSWGEAEVVEAGPVARASAPGAGPPAWSQSVTLAAYRTGEIRLPTRSVAPPGSWPESAPGSGLEDGALSTPEALSFRVDSVLPPDAGPGDLEPAPPAPLHPLPAGEPFWWTLWVATLLAVASVGTALLRASSSGAAGEPRAEGLPRPYDELLRRLDGLATPDDAGTIERRHVELSHALRRYLGRSLDLPATESTTTEVLRLLRARRVPGPVISESGEILRACDRVKFAREPVEPSVLGERIDAARELAGALERHLRPPAGSEEAA